MKPSYVLALLALAVALPSLAQVPSGDGDRASTPPGTSRDGAAPSDGAIKGGAIAPGETGGMPDKSATPSSERAMNRCNDLEGTLREQCLRQQRGASTGGASAPGPGAPPSPREAPPPQNPR